MQNITQHTGTLRVLHRLPSSVYGNPRYLISIHNGPSAVTCRTAPDSSHGYSVTNYEGKKVVATIGTYYGKATLNTIQEVK